MRLPLFPLESPFGVWGLLAIQKTPRPTSPSKERFAKFEIATAPHYGGETYFIKLLDAFRECGYTIKC